jgi:hypothetical protein
MGQEGLLQELLPEVVQHAEREVVVQLQEQHAVGQQK